MRVDVPCLLCGNSGLFRIVELDSVPAQDGVVYASRRAALQAPEGTVDLVYCGSCSLIFNAAYDSSCVEFGAYSYSQIHSPQYRRHVDTLVRTLADSFDINNKRVVDIGCGEGYFLRSLCAFGDNQGVGIDPSLPSELEVDTGPAGISFLQAYYGPEHASLPRDLTSCRHVLDELADPIEFVRQILPPAGTVDPGLVYFEVPNALRTFEGALIWNVGYAKRCWFTGTSLERLLNSCGFSVRWSEKLFGDEYLGVIASRSSVADPVCGRQDNSSSLPDSLAGFADKYTRETTRWQRRLEEFTSAGEQVVLWGAGMRGINFLHRFRGKDAIAGVVDINEDRQGRFLPGSAMQVEAPDVLEKRRPTRIIVSNPTYLTEITTHVRSMGLVCEIEAL